MRGQQLLLVDAEVYVKLRLGLGAGGQHHQRFGDDLVHLERDATHVQADLEAREPGELGHVGQAAPGVAHEGQARR